MKKKLFFGLLCLFTCTSLVKAETLSEPLASIVKNGTLSVNMEKPQNITLDTVNSRIRSQYSKYLQDDENGTSKNLYLTACSSDYSTCTLVFHGCETSGGCGEVPTTVKVEWEKDSVDNYSEAFKKTAPNGVISFNAIAPKNDEELDAYSSYFLDTDLYYLSNCN